MKMKTAFTWIFITVAISLRAQFIEESKHIGIDHVCHDVHQMSAGVAFFDFNNDGFEDVVVTGTLNDSKIFENQGNGTFKDVSAELGFKNVPNFMATGVITADFDNDGFTDLYFTTYLSQRSYLFWNEGGKSFTESAISSGVGQTFFGTSAAVADYNLDGYLDLYAGNYTGTDYLYENKDGRTFTDQSSLLNHGDGVGSALAVAFSDIDMDGDMDILLGNEYEQLPQLSNKLFINNYPKKTFTEMSEPMTWDLRINTMGIATGDYDEDGDFDYYVSDISDNYFFEKNEGLVLEEKAYVLGVANDESTSWGTAFFDFDNDTYLDLFVSNGTIGASDTESQEDKLFKGAGEGVFSDVSSIQGVNNEFRARGMSFGDFNNDGRLDLLVGIMWYDIPELENSHTLLYRNTNTSGNWLKIKLQGTESNHDAYGAMVKVVTGGRSFIREQSGGGTYLSHNSKTIHFGLGDYTKLDSLIIKWPGGNEDIFKDLPANNTFLVAEKTNLYRVGTSRIDLCSDESIQFGEQQITHEGIYYDTLLSDSDLSKIEILRVHNALEENCIVTALDEQNSITIQELQVYPNPFQSSITLDIPQFAQQVSEVWLSDLYGTAVLKLDIPKSENGNITVVDTEYLPPGIYLMHLLTGKEKKTFKLIKKN